MGIPNSTRALFLGAAGAAGGAYEISRSLRFNSADSAYLSRTPSTAGNRRTYTWSGWVKRAALGSGTYYLFTAVDGANVDIIGFEADRFYWYNSYSGGVNSQALYRDPSAWYHVLAAVDSTQATSSNRVKLYVNGAEIAYNAVLYPSLNRDFAVNNTVAHKVGQYFTTNSSDFYLADIHFIDGQALDPTSFTEVDATTGQLIPKAYNTVLPDSVTLVPSIAEGALIIKADDATITGSVTAAGFVKVHSSSDGINWTYREQILSGALSFSAKYIAIGGGSTNSRTFNPSTGGSYTWAEYSAGTQFDTTSNITQDVTGLTYTASGTVTAPYGTNGFHLPFSDNSTTAALGTDTSGNGNTWTVNNITANVTQPALYSSPNLYTSAADVIANGTPLFSGSTFSNVYVYLVTNSGGDVGSKVFTADGAGTIGGSSWTWLHRIGAAWEFLGSYNNTEWDLWTWGSQTTATTYVMNNSAPLHMLVSSSGSPQKISGTIATFNSTPNSGADNDSLVDTPTSYGTDTGAGGEVRGNYATLNPLFIGNGQGTTLSNGNLDYLSTAGVGNYATRFNTIGVSSGKWYSEFTINATGNGLFLGISSDPGAVNNYIGQNATSWGYLNTGTKWTNGGSSSYGASYTAGDVIGVTLDLDAGTISFYKNGTSQGTAYSSLATGTYFIGVSGTTNVSISCNYGQRPFAYTAPSGYKALCTANLPAPVVAQPSTVMDVVLYNANGSTQTISGLGFAPDLVWSKSRNRAYPHGLHDSVRGAYKYLRSSGTNAETDTSGDPALYTLTSFNSDGFSVGPDGGAGVINNNGAGATTYVAWTWDAGSSTVTNTQGSITSSVRANPSAGFSIVTWNPGTTSSGTVGHALGVAPQLIILKPRSTSGNWAVYHSSLGNGGLVWLNLTNAFSAGSAWNSTTPTSTVFSYGNNSNTYLANQDFVAYCFAPVAGYSSMGSYVGNGSTDGPFVYTGFRPRWILLKSSTEAVSWVIYDTARNTYNLVNSTLSPDLSSAESAPGVSGGIDILSNGFKLRSSDQWLNFNAATYVWAAFAESPFQYARAR